MRNLRGLTRRQARQVILDAVCDDRRFDADDINRMLAAKRRAIGDGLLEYVEAPVSLDEIGGLRAAQGRGSTRRQNCLERRRASTFGLPAPRGVLMLGVQGAGKSLSAKAVATAWQRPLLRLDAGALYDRYIGESERRLRDALHQAERMAPVVLWIDEIEKGFASAASHSSDGGLSQAHVRHAADVDAGAHRAGLPRRDGQRHRGPAAGAAAQGPLRRDLLRRPARRSRRATRSSPIHLKKRKRDPKQFDLDALAEAVATASAAPRSSRRSSARCTTRSRAKAELTTEHVADGAEELAAAVGDDGGEDRGAAEWSEGRCVPAD